MFIIVLFGREDDDNSDDDLEDKKRVSLNYREIAHKERQETRQNFLAYEEGKIKKMFGYA